MATRLLTETADRINFIQPIGNIVNIELSDTNYGTIGFSEPIIHSYRSYKDAVG